MGHRLTDLAAEAFGLGIAFGPVAGRLFASDAAKFTV